jgi:hypothetical protein
MMMIISCFATAGIGNDFHAAFFDPVGVLPELRGWKISIHAEIYVANVELLWI